MTRERVEFLTTLALFRTRETVAVETRARRATCSRFMVFPNCKRTAAIADPHQLDCVSRRLSGFQWDPRLRAAGRVRYELARGESRRPHYGWDAAAVLER